MTGSSSSAAKPGSRSRQGPRPHLQYVLEGQIYGDGCDGTGGGAGSDDTFWWSAGTFIMDLSERPSADVRFPAGRRDHLWPALEKGVVGDWLLPLIPTLHRGQAAAGELGRPQCRRKRDELLGHSMVIENYDFAAAISRRQRPLRHACRNPREPRLVFRVYNAATIPSTLFGGCSPYRNLRGGSEAVRQACSVCRRTTRSSSI